MVCVVSKKQFKKKSIINEATKDSGECVENPKEPSNNEEDDKWDIDLMRARRWNQIVEKLRDFCFICKKELLITENMYCCVRVCDLNGNDYANFCEKCLNNGNCPKCGKKLHFSEALDLKKEMEYNEYKTRKTMFDTTDDDSGDDVQNPKEPVLKKVQLKKDYTNIINLPEIPKHKIDKTWNKKLKELMAKGEEIFNESNAKCDFEEVLDLKKEKEPNKYKSRKNMFDTTDDYSGDNVQNPIEPVLKKYN